MKSLRFTLLALVSTVALYACGGNTTSSADTGVTSAQVQQMIASAIAPLQSQIATLQSQVGASAPAVFIKAPNAPAVKAASQMRGTSQKATTQPSCTGLGTLTGRPSNSDPIASDLISGVSCTGYFFTISAAATSAQQAIVQPLQGNLSVFFDAPNCAGNAYVAVSTSGVSQGALANGAVFRVPTNPDDPTVASTYWMLQPGTTSSQPVILSQYQNGQCNAVSISQFVVYQLAPNNQTVSGVPSAPVQGPVTIG